MSPATITYDRHGTPGIHAANLAQLYWGIGWLHGRHRPVQTAVLALAAAGRLAGSLLPRAQLVNLDALFARLNVAGRAAQQAEQLDHEAGPWVDAYCAGVNAAFGAARPWELRLLGVDRPTFDRRAVLGGLLISSYLGLAEGQERMELALVELLEAGAEPRVLEEMFSPHLAGWDVATLRGMAQPRPLGFVGVGRTAGGSNAWAVTPERTASGRAMLCGDPHLQIDQLPGLFFEVRARVGDDVWLGATIPGLPGLALGRTRRLAWSGTFAVADNVDLTIEELRGGKVQRDTDSVDLVRREVVIRRRFRSPLRLRFFDWQGAAALSADAADGRVLVPRWSGAEDTAAALSAYLRLPLAADVQQAETTLGQAHSFSLHFVLADASGAVRYVHAGRMPRRRAGWSGLYPVRGDGRPPWDGYRDAGEQPRLGPEDGIIVSANEARQGNDGAWLSTLAQPSYRLTRIRQLLLATAKHDRASMAAIQTDVLSLQARRLLPRFRAALPEGTERAALDVWDFGYGADSVGAPIFARAYAAAVAGLGARLGGEAWASALASSELGIWWCAAIDRLLESPATWEGPAGAELATKVGAAVPGEPVSWGETQSLMQRHMLFGGLPWPLRFDRGPTPLVGSIATVRQGNLVPMGAARMGIGPAYRMICDFAEPGLWTTLAGGIDGDPRHSTYDCWRDEWLAGRLHVLNAPSLDEATVFPNRATASAEG